MLNIVILQIFAGVTTVHTTFLLTRKPSNNELAHTIDTFTRENSISVRAIFVHPLCSDHINDVAATLFKSQSIKLHSIQRLVLSTDQIKDSVIRTTKADALLGWFIVPLIVILKKSEIVQRIIHQEQINQHTGLIFLMDTNALSSLTESVLRNFISNVEPSEAVIISMNPIGIMSVYKENAGLNLTPYHNPLNNPIMMVSTAYNSLSIFSTQRPKKATTSCIKDWKYLQGIDIWMPQILANMFNKTAMFTFCLPKNYQNRRQVSSVLPNAYLEHIYSNISICNDRFADGSDLYASTYK